MPSGALAGPLEASAARRREERAFVFLFRNRRARSFFRLTKRKKPFKKTNTLTEAVISKELAAGKTWFSASPDTRGRPYILSPSNRHQRSTRDLAASRLALVYAMDAAARAADAAKASGVGDGRVVSVIDARGVGLANLDPEVSKMVVEIAQVRKRVFLFLSLSFSSFSLFISLSLSLQKSTFSLLHLQKKNEKKTQDHYPERSLTTFIFGAPSAFAAIVQLLLPLVSPSSRGKIKFVKAGSDWASAGVAIDGSVVIDGASLPRVLGGTGPDAVPVQVAARSVGILKDLPVPAVDPPAWGVSAGGGEEVKEEEGKEEEEASAASASAAAPAAEGKATEQRSGVVSLTATAAS